MRERNKQNMIQPFDIESISFAFQIFGPQSKPCRMTKPTQRRAQQESPRNDISFLFQKGHSSLLGEKVLPVFKRPLETEEVNERTNSRENTLMMARRR